MSPDEARAWIRVIRDGVLVLSGTVIVAVVLVLYIVRQEPPNYTLLAWAGACFGLGAALRAGELVIRAPRNGSNDGAR